MSNGYVFVDNVMIMGSGRSGTSLAAGTLAQSGYYMGDMLLSASPSNPKGFFEDREVNAINEDILAVNALKRPPVIGKILFRQRPLKHQRWLAQVPIEREITVPPGVEQRIRAMVKQAPFCFKDPRFCYTLPAWLTHLSHTVFVVVYRHPSVTANSIVRECKTDVRLHTLKMDYEHALEVWSLMYRHLLEKHRAAGRWLVLEYGQLFTPSGLRLLEQFTGANVDRTFPDPALNRSRAAQSVPKDVERIYELLGEWAERSQAVLRKNSATQ